MPESTVDTLRNFIANTVDLPDGVRTPLVVAAVRELIAAGDLAPAAASLKELGDPSDATTRESVASQWLVLARAHGGNQGAESALRNAARLDPVHGLPALGQYLQRQKRWDEAAAVWRKLIQHEPSEPNAYLNLGRSYERLARPGDAVAAYLELIAAAPSARSYLTVANRLDELAQELPAVADQQSVRIALLGNATLDHLASYLRVECFRAGLRPTIYQAPYDQVTQEILDPQSGLYAFAPDVVICAVHASRLFPRVHQDPFDLSVEERRAEIDAGLSAVEKLLDTVT
jgi:tetratricopeptide (TPR) repeat protein